MPTVNRTGRATSSTASNGPRRFEVLKQLEAKVKKLNSDGTRPPEVDLERTSYTLLLSPNGKVLEFRLDDRDEEKMGSSWPPFRSVAIDDENKEFYYSSGGTTRGPVDLPRGVTSADLFDDGSYVPRGRNDYEKSIEKLTRTVKAATPEIAWQGNTQLDYSGGAFRSPDGEALYHHYIEDEHDSRANRFHMPGGALMLGENHFWVEQIPGISGNCVGPFEYPRGFDVDVIKNFDDTAGAGPVRDSSSTLTSSSSSGSRSTGYATGGDSGTWRQPAPRRTIGGGGSGSWPASWGPTPGGSGS